MLRVLTVDPHPALRAGVAVLLRDEPGIVGVGAAASTEDGLALAAREHPDVVLLDPELLAGGFAVCRRFKAADPTPGVVIYTGAAADPQLALQARVAGADGVVDKSASPQSLFEAVRLVGRGESALPPLSPAQLEIAAHRVEPDDLALLAMLADRTSPDEVAETLRLDRRRIGPRIERLLARLRSPLTARAV